MIKAFGSVAKVALSLLLVLPLATSCITPPNNRSDRATPNSDRTVANTTSNTSATPKVRRTWQGRILEDPQDQIRIKLPRGWEMAPEGTLNPNAELYAYNPSKNIYLVVVGESSNALRYNNLSDNANTYLGLLKNGLSSTSQQETTELNTVGPYPAVQYLVRGTVENTPVVYLHTTIAAKDKYYQVVSWTTEQLYNQNRTEMQNVIASFQEG